MVARQRLAKALRLVFGGVNSVFIKASRLFDRINGLLFHKRVCGHSHNTLNVRHGKRCQQRNTGAIAMANQHHIALACGHTQGLQQRWQHHLRLVVHKGGLPGLANRAWCGVAIPFARIDQAVRAHSLAQLTGEITPHRHAA